ncbi:unnamed protein product [Nippostrongylus brasiliensis]|uniref:WAPL domain-containing protein n=1 Tax=Nippostrongylus brasiliensis TaxID=27835 RepID=A0A3P7B5J8_NIPBR|nr:unnamed protein product [Nippostrongylus brasiliensis]
MPKKRWQTQKQSAGASNEPTAVDSLPSVADAEPSRDSPKQVFSPPISLPESTSTDGTIENDHGLSSSDEDSQSVPSVERIDSVSSTALLTPMKFAAVKEQRPVYQHKWTENDDDDRACSASEFGVESTSTLGCASSAQQKQITSAAYPSRVSRVKEAHQCLESGEHDDFKQDIEYILSTMRGGATVNIKCLSTLSLARKCVSAEFRQFVRSEGLVSSVFKGLSDAASNQNLAVCAATVIYLMSRDFISMQVDAHSLRLFSQLLRIEKLDHDEEQEKYISMVWDVFTAYVDKMELTGKKIVFDFTKDQLTPSSLILESLVFVLARCSDENLKSELLNLGILQWIVGKEDTIQQLVILERCFRILESSTLFHKKNQAFLISHRGSLLIQMCGKLMNIIHETISNSSVGSVVARSHMTCLSLMARVLMNLSHENELCCTKLGQVPGFLPLCLSSYTFLAPKFAPEDRKFDLYVMMTSLCVNLVERCNSNRRKIIETVVKVHGSNGEDSEHKALDALAIVMTCPIYSFIAISILFTIHEAKARNIDEDLDKDLAFEEPVDEENNDSDDEARNDGRLDRAKMDEMNESEMLQAVQNAMSKVSLQIYDASAHMEDSVVASYVALLIGCLLQQNEVSFTG